MAMLLRCLFSPRLYYIYKKRDRLGHDYEPYLVEKCSDMVIKWFRFCWSFSYWTSPVLLIIMYRKEAFTRDGMLTMTTYGSSLGVILLLAYCARALGRFANSEYKDFLATLRESCQIMNQENKRKISQYDFEFYAWPVEFKSKRDRAHVNLSQEFRARGIVEKIRALPCHILSYLAIHTFGRRFVYPGATSLIHALVSPMLIQGRTKLIEEKSAVRYKIQTADNNQIDSIFVDRRNNPDFPDGDTLVICCEGNAGFYEIGCMVTALEAGYSVLGWNHPGFGGSTGAPYPSQEHNAVDAVVQFADQRLGFKLYDVMLFAWSIGGYSATWAAMNYPEIRSVVLDATFDDIVPLALARMPQSWKTLVRLTMRKYMNLANAEQICKYPGPVLIIRCSRDEMITTIDPTTKSSNRGNFLLMKLLQHRYPRILREDTLPTLTQWFSTDRAGQVVLLSERDVDDDWCTSILKSYVEENSLSYPMLVGDDMSKSDRQKLLLFLASMHMDEFDATHCQPLPASYLRQPWSLAL